jgi:hypothetical protein
MAGKKSVKIRLRSLKTIAPLKNPVYDLGLLTYGQGKKSRYF